MIAAAKEKDHKQLQLAAYDLHRYRILISEDPIGLAGGINPYVYAGNDPINSSDPLGLQREVRRCIRGHYEDVNPAEGLIASWVCDEWSRDLANPFSDRFGNRGSGIPQMGSPEWMHRASGATQPAQFDLAAGLVTGVFAGGFTTVRSIGGQLSSLFQTAGARGVVTGFTRHGLNQVINRGVRPGEILDALRLGEGIREVDVLGRVAFRYVGPRATVVLNRAGQVVTAWRGGWWF